MATGFSTNVNINNGTMTQAISPGPTYTYNGQIVKQVIASRITVNTSQFKRKKKLYQPLIELPQNPFTYSREIVTGGFGYMIEKNLYNPSQTVTHTGYFAVFFGNTLGGTVLELSSEELSQLQSRINAKLLEKLKDQRVNLAQVFAERKRTADLIGDTAIKLVNSFRALKKGRFGDAARALGVSASRRKTRAFNRAYRIDRRSAISNGWLQLQYGWRPLLQDIYGSAEFLASKQLREIRSVVTSRLTRNLSLSSKVPESPNYWDVVTEKQTRVDYSGRIRFATTGAALATAKEAGLTNPAAVAWEVTPYSFVVDWFIPIGGYLNSLDATIGLSFQSGSYTHFFDGWSRTRLEAFNRKGASMFYSASTFYGVVNSHRTKVFCQRTPFYTFPAPELPTFKNPFSFERALNAVALLFQTFKR
jgi:hypothetical protein